MTMKTLIVYYSLEGNTAYAADRVAAALGAEPSAKEIRLTQLLSLFPVKVSEAGAALSPAVIANYAYDLAKEFNQYYHDTPILKEADQAVLKYRLALIAALARTLRSAMALLGIALPERM